MVKASQQQQNKAVLAESAADNVIQGYLQNLLSDNDDQPNWGALNKKKTLFSPTLPYQIFTYS